MYKIVHHLLRPLLLFAAFIIGYSCPFLNNLEFIVPWLVRAMLFFVFLQLDWSLLRIRVSHVLILLANVGIPLTFWGLFMLLGHPILAVGAFFAGIAPTGTAAAPVVSFLRQNVEYAVTAFVVSSLGVSFIVPFLMPMVLIRGTVAGESSVSPDFWAIFSSSCMNVAGLVFIPIVISLVLRWIYPPVRYRGKRVIKNFSFMLWILTITIMCAYAANFIENSKTVTPMFLIEAIGVSFLVCAANFSFGRLLSWKYSHESSQTLGQKNVLFTFILAMNYAQPLCCLVPLTYMVWHNTWNAVQLIRLPEETA